MALSHRLFQSRFWRKPKNSFELKSFRLKRRLQVSMQLETCFRWASPFWTLLCKFDTKWTSLFLKMIINAFKKRSVFQLRLHRHGNVLVLPPQHVLRARCLLPLLHVRVRNRGDQHRIPSHVLLWLSQSCPPCLRDKRDKKRTKAWLKLVISLNWNRTVA